MAAKKKNKKTKAKKAARKKSPARKAKKAPARKAASKTVKKKAAKKTKAARKAAPAAKKAVKKRKAAKKARPAKKKKQIVGEGDYAATRAFDTDQAGFVKRNKADIPKMGKAAEAALDGPEGDALREAEAEGLARSRDMF